MSRIRTITLSVVALAAAGGALAACSSSGGATAPKTGSTPPASTPPSTVTSTAPTVSTTVTSSGTGSHVATGNSTNSQCAESQLRASVVPDNIPGLDRHVVKLVFKNISTSTCTITGYPGAAIEDSDNHQVQQAKRVEGGPVGGTIEQHYHSAVVKPGATAYAFLEGESTREVGAAQAGCDGPKYPRILVTPPNTSTPVPFTIGWPQCYAFDVHPIREQ